MTQLGALLAACFGLGSRTPVESLSKGVHIPRRHAIHCSRARGQDGSHTEYGREICMSLGPWMQTATSLKASLRLSLLGRVAIAVRDHDMPWFRPCWMRCSSSSLRCVLTLDRRNTQETGHCQPRCSSLFGVFFATLSVSWTRRQERLGILEGCTASPSFACHSLALCITRACLSALPAIPNRKVGRWGGGSVPVVSAAGPRAVKLFSDVGCACRVAVPSG